MLVMLLQCFRVSMGCMHMFVCMLQSAIQETALVPVHANPLPANVRALAASSGQYAAAIWDVGSVLLQANMDDKFKKLRDPDNHILSMHLLVNKAHHASKLVDSKTTGVGRKKLQRFESRLAMACILAERRHVFNFIGSVVQGVKAAGGQLVCFSESVRYDETPMRCRVNDTESLAMIAQLSQEVTASYLMDFKDSSVMKLCQSEFTVAMLVSIGTTFLFFQIPVTCWLQALDSTKAECMWQAQQDIRLHLDMFSKQFSRKQRICTSDGASAIAKCERGFVNGLVDTSLLHIICEIHVAAGLRSKTMRILDGAVSKAIHLALCLNFGSAMLSMRKQLRLFFRSNLKYVKGTPPPENLEKVKLLLDTFCSESDKPTRLRRTIIEILVTWDIHSTDITHICNGCCSSYEDCLSKFEGYFVQAVCGRAPHIYPRHRWTGQEKPINWIGLFEGISRLFSVVFQEFAAAKSTSSGAAIPKAEAPALFSAILDQAGADAADIAGEAASNLESEVPAGVAGADPSASTWEQQQAANAARARSVQKWCHGDGPLADVILTKRVLEPQAHLMYTMLILGGDVWQNTQQGAELLGIQQGKCGTGLLRKYRILIAAQQVLETELMDAVARLMVSGERWAVMPLTARTAEVRSKAFSALSMTLCLANELKVRHRSYPFKLFLLLLDTKIKDEILSESCMWDNWSADFISKHSGHPDGIASAPALHDLKTSALLCHLDTSQVEAKHAYIRRVLMLSVQTHLDSLSHVSASDVLRRYRMHAKRIQKLIDPSPESHEAQHSGDAASTSTDYEHSAAAPSIRGGGGAWRAFISAHQGMAESADFKLMSAMYASLSDEEKQEFIDKGSKATVNHRDTGGLSFGPQPRELVRVCKAIRASNQANFALQHDPLSIRPITLNRDHQLLVSSCSASGWHRLKEVKSLCDAEHKQKRQEQAVNNDSLNRYEVFTNQGQAAMVHAASLLPALSQFHASLSAVPSTSATPESQLHHIRWNPSQSTCVAKSALDISARTKVGSVLASTLDSAWTRLHSTVPTQEVAQFQKAEKHSLCAFAGVCVCTKGQNGHLPKMKVMFDSASKAFVKGSKIREEALVKAQTVVLLLGFSEATCKGLDEEALLTTTADATMWYHIGFHSKKPWKSSFHILQGPVGTMHSLSSENHELRSSCVVCAQWEGLSKLRADFKWLCCFFVISPSAKLTGSVVPDRVDVAYCPCAAFTHKIVWDPYKKRPRKRKCGWAVDLSDGSDEEAEGNRPPEDPLIAAEVLALHDAVDEYASAQPEQDEEDIWVLRTSCFSCGLSNLNDLMQLLSFICYQFAVISVRCYIDMNRHVWVYLLFVVCASDSSIAPVRRGTCWTLLTSLRWTQTLALVLWMSLLQI
jgi:hypothetical protein